MDPDWNELVTEFEKCIKEYGCGGEHRIVHENVDSTYWSVQAHFYDYNVRECYNTVCVCTSKEIAINEACRRLYRECQGSFFNAINPFSKYAERLADLDVSAEDSAEDSDECSDECSDKGTLAQERKKKLLEMQQQLTSIVQCVKCFQIGGSEQSDNIFDTQDGCKKFLVKPYDHVITIMRPHADNYGKEAEENEEEDDDCF